MDYGQPTIQDGKQPIFTPEKDIHSDVPTPNKEPNLPSPEHNLGEIGSSAIESSKDSPESANFPKESIENESTPELGQVINAELPPGAEIAETQTPDEITHNNSVKIQANSKGPTSETKEFIRKEIGDFRAGKISPADFYAKFRGKDGHVTQYLKNSFGRERGEKAA